MSLENGSLNGTGEGEMDWEFGMGICTLWYMELLANMDLLYSTGNSTQYALTIYMGEGSEKE